MLLSDERMCVNGNRTNTPQIGDDDWLPYTLRRGLTDEALRQTLVDALAVIDQKKRDIKLAIQSEGRRAREAKQWVDQHWLHRIKTKEGYLQRQREEIRRAIGDVGARMREFRRRAYGLTTVEVAEAFVVAAQEQLSEETFYKILDVAAKNASRQQPGAARSRQCQGT